MSEDTTLREGLDERALEAAAAVLSPQLETFGYGREQFARAVITAYLAAASQEREPERKINDGTRLRLLEAALLNRDWMRVMDVVEDMGGNWRIGQQLDPAGGRNE